MKQNWKPGTLIYPLPAVLVSCGASPDEYNLFTASWVGTLCTNPPMCYVSIRPERHSYGIIRRNMEFTLNLTTTDMARATDWCGVRSGRDYDKWKESRLTPHAGVEVRSPYVEESPLGSHDMFIADVVNILADDKYIDAKSEAFDMGKARLLVYSHGHYYETGSEIGKFGWSVQKKHDK